MNNLYDNYWWGLGEFYDGLYERHLAEGWGYTTDDARAQALDKAAELAKSGLAEGGVYISEWIQALRLPERTGASVDELKVALTGSGSDTNLLDKYLSEEDLRSVIAEGFNGSRSVIDGEEWYCIAGGLEFCVVFKPKNIM